MFSSLSRNTIDRIEGFGIVGGVVMVLTLHPLPENLLVGYVITLIGLFFVGLGVAASLHKEVE